MIAKFREERERLLKRVNEQSKKREIEVVVPEVVVHQMGFQCADCQGELIIL
jgi:hypothetical protein